MECCRNYHNRIISNPACCAVKKSTNGWSSGSEAELSVAYEDAGYDSTNGNREGKGSMSGITGARSLCGAAEGPTLAPNRRAGQSLLVDKQKYKGASR